MHRFFAKYLLKPPVIEAFVPPAYALPLKTVKPRILLLKLDMVGDFITAIASFDALRNRWPRAQVTLVCSPSLSEFARSSGYFDRIVPFQFFSPLRDILRPSNNVVAKRFLKETNLPRFDIAIDLRHDEDTRFLLNAVDASYKCGFESRWFKGRLDVQLNASGMSNESRLLLLTRAVIDAFAIAQNPLAKFNLDDVSKFAPKDRFIVLAPSARTDIKEWPVKNFIAVCRGLINDGLQIVLIGDRATKPISKKIMGEIGSGVTDLCGRLKLTDLPPLMRNAEMFIGNDTGPGHIAAGIGIPTLVIFSGSADISVWHPRGSKTVALKAKISCSPCGLAQARECRFEQKCLTLISPDVVLRHARDILRSERKSSGRQ
jgi:ADP-heptose:LPS heptosyltransferase